MDSAIYIPICFYYFQGDFANPGEKTEFTFQYVSIISQIIIQKS